MHTAPLSASVLYSHPSKAVQVLLTLLEPMQWHRRGDMLTTTTKFFVQATGFSGIATAVHFTADFCYLPSYCEL